MDEKKDKFGFWLFDSIIKDLALLLIIILQIAILAKG